MENDLGLSKSGFPVLEKCTPEQALRWLAYDLPPLAEGHEQIESYPAWREDDINGSIKKAFSDQIARLIAALSRGDIIATGHHVRTNSLDQIHIYEISELEEPVLIEPEPVSDGSVEISCEAWGQVFSWDLGSLPVLGQSRGFEFEEYIDISIPFNALKNKFPYGAKKNKKNHKKKERRGAKPRYNWVEFFDEINHRVELNGLPNTQAQLESDMAAWCDDKWGEEPSISTIRRKITPLYDDLNKQSGS